MTSTSGKYALLLPCLICCLLCCSPRENKEENNFISADSAHADSTNQNEVATSSRSVFDIQNDTLWEDSLRKYFTDEQIIKIKQAKNEYTHISRARDLASFYTVTLPAICSIFNTQTSTLTPSEMGDISPKKTWKWFTEYFPVIYGDVLCLDCDFSPMNDIRSLALLAAKTPEQEDDLFFDLAIEAYGDSSYSCSHDFFFAKGWYVVANECDVCKMSLLGNGGRLKLIGKLKRAAAANALFGDEMNRISAEVFSIYTGNFYYSKKEVFDEIEKILNSSLLTAEEKSHIQEQAKQIQSRSQFNCTSYQACTW